MTTLPPGRCLCLLHGSKQEDQSVAGALLNQGFESHVEELRLLLDPRFLHGPHYQVVPQNDGGSHIFYMYICIWICQAVDPVGFCEKAKTDCRPGRLTWRFPMGKPVVHFEISSTNSAEAQKFYSSLFNWKIDANNPQAYGLISAAEGIGINGGIYQTDEGRSSTIAYVAVEDTDAYLKKVEALGGTVVKPTEVVPGMVTFALFADPFGNIMGLVKDEMPAKPAPKPAAQAAAKKSKPAPKKSSAKKSSAKKPAAKKPAAKSTAKPAKKSKPAGKKKKVKPSRKPGRR